MRRRRPVRRGTPAASSPTFTPVTDVETLRAHIPPSLSRTCRTPRTDLDDPAGRTVGGRPVRAGARRHLRGESGLLLLLRLRRHPRRRPRRTAPTTLPARCRPATARPIPPSSATSATAPAAPCAATPTARTTGSSPGPPTGSAIVASAADRTMTYADLNRWWRHAGPIAEVLIARSAAGSPHHLLSVICRITQH